MKRNFLIGAALAAGILASHAIAQDNADTSNMGEGMMMNMSGEPRGDQGPASKAFAKANLAMHGAMNIEFSGNADVDFAKGMIAHHQGAIDMAKIELEFGKDPEMRKLAEGVITAQEAEIAFMKSWLEKNGG